MPASAAKKIELAPAFGVLLRYPMLILIMFQGVSVFVLARILQVNLFQPILSEKHFALSSYGVVMSVTSIFEAIGSAWPSTLRRWLSDLNSVFVLTLAMALSLSFMALSPPFGLVVWMSVFSLACGLSFPIQRQLFNDAIPAEGVPYRATLMSMESIIDRAACAGVAAVLGGWVSSGRTFLFLHISAVVSIVAMLILFFALNRRSAPRPSRGLRMVLND